MSENPVLPPIDEENAPFWDAARRGELCVQRCPDTQRLIFPPRSHSPWGNHQAPEWVPVSGRGTVWSFVVAHPPLLPYFAERAPYNVIVVALEEDPSVRLVGNLVGDEGETDIAAIDPATITIGTPVRVVFDPEEDGIRLPRWIQDEGSP